MFKSFIFNARHIGEDTRNTLLMTNTLINLEKLGKKSFFSPPIIPPVTNLVQYQSNS